MVATPLPRNYFDGTEFADSIANEKRALLALIAERGTEGAAAYNAAKELSDSTRAASSEGAAAHGAAVNSSKALTAKINNDYDAVNNAYRDAMAYEQLGHGREMDRIALSNSAYKDAVMAAQPGLQAAMDAQIRALALRAGVGGGGGGGGGGRRGGSGGGGGGKGTAPTESYHEDAAAASQDPLLNPWLYPDAASQGMTIGPGGRATPWYDPKRGGSPATWASGGGTAATGGRIGSFIPPKSNRPAATPTTTRNPGRRGGRGTPSGGGGGGSVW